MMRHIIALTIIGIIAAVVIVQILATKSEPDDTHAHHEHDAHSDASATGPHGGRMLEKDDFALEIMIYETGLPPEFRVYAYHAEQPVSPEQVSLEMTLGRTGGETQRIGFSPQNDFLRGDGEVYEPHSFEVSVSAGFDGNEYTWRYDQLEGRTRIPEAIASEMGIGTETVGPVLLTETRTLTGRVQTNPNRLSRVRPRFPGVVKKIHRELGDLVKAGDVLATMQSNESLQDYQVTAPIAGQIVKRDIQVGEASGQEPLFIIADLSEVWAELDVFVRDLALVNAGQPVRLESLDGSYSKTATIDWVSPLTAHASQSVRARAAIPNADGALRPGMFIRGHVVINEVTVPLAVRQSAIQSFRDFRVVYARFDNLYEVRMLELGRQNSEWAEVLNGIEPGTRYVTENSYLIKADIEKSGASHDH